jgi:DNA-binding MarR family transcriptional regulator
MANELMNFGVGAEPNARPLSEEGLKRAKRIVALGRVLDEFRKLNPSMPVSQIQALLLVALDLPMGMGDYAERTGVKPSTASRYLLDLGPPRHPDDSAFGLIDRGVDPQEPRRARYTLSKRGKQLVKQILNMMEE